MHKLETNLRRFFYHLQHDFLTANNIVNAVAIVTCLWFTIGAVSSMSRNWELKQKLQEKYVQLAKVKLEVEKLQLEQEYYKTDEYKELLARSKGGKMAEGETMVVLPKNSNEAKNAHKDTGLYTQEEKSNFEQWMDLLFK
ncbi:MAG: septum formation initiator family protein [Candidatus Saccharibacteria bacterium]|nr:septum formation initiator family protein [Candidatus Saccharibacteria bacterium]